MPVDPTQPQTEAPEGWPVGESAEAPVEAAGAAEEGPTEEELKRQEAAAARSRERNRRKGVAKELGIDMRNPAALVPLWEMLEEIRDILLHGSGDDDA